jgi:hypothetical protein
MGPWWQWSGLGIAAVAFVIYNINVNRANSRALEALRTEFRGRPQADLERWFQTGWAGLGVPEDRVVTILEPIAKILQCDLTQLHPEDSFTGTLRWRGSTFLSADDDNPWDDFVEEQLPAICGGPDKAIEVIHRIEEDPTLAALVQVAA